MDEEELDTLEWDLKDRDWRVVSGELLADVPDPTEVLVEGDE